MPPVVQRRTAHFHCRGHRTSPGQGTKIPQGTVQPKGKLVRFSEFISDSVCHFLPPDLTQPLNKRSTFFSFILTCEGIEVKVTQSCPTLGPCGLCSPPGSSVHGILQVGINTGLGCHSFLQGIFLTQRLNSGLLHCRQILYCLSHQERVPFFTSNLFLDLKLTYLPQMEPFNSQ